MSKSLTIEDVKKLTGKEYILVVPTDVPDGQVLVHNQVTGWVRRNTPPGTNGFRHGSNQRQRRT